MPLNRAKAIDERSRGSISAAGIDVRSLVDEVHEVRQSVVLRYPPAAVPQVVASPAALPQPRRRCCRWAAALDGTRARAIAFFL